MHSAGAATRVPPVARACPIQTSSSEAKTWACSGGRVRSRCGMRAARAAGWLSTTPSSAASTATRVRAVAAPSSSASPRGGCRGSGRRSSSRRASPLSASTSRGGGCSSRRCRSSAGGRTRCDSSTSARAGRRSPTTRAGWSASWSTAVSSRSTGRALPSSTRAPPASLSPKTCTTRASCLSRSARRKSRCVPSAAVSPSSRLRSGAGAAPTRACPRSNSPSRRRSTRSFLWSCRRCPCRGLSPASARPAPTASPSSAMARRSGRAEAISRPFFNGSMVWARSRTYSLSVQRFFGHGKLQSTLMRVACSSFEEEGG
mmetsp:Transcript_26252/g.87478  ORF Transcript_26252/g.87478 Transcript_26252/m.87478 type:complete len:316 (-) Transcript_26252:60-1007(-)